MSRHLYIRLVWPCLVHSKYSLWCYTGQERRALKFATFAWDPRFVFVQISIWKVMQAVLIVWLFGKKGSGLGRLAFPLKLFLCWFPSGIKIWDLLMCVIGDNMKKKCFSPLLYKCYDVSGWRRGCFSIQEQKTGEQRLHRRSLPTGNYISFFSY